MPGMLNWFFMMIWKKEVKRTHDHCIFFYLGSDWDFSNIDSVFNSGERSENLKKNLITKKVKATFGPPLLPIKPPHWTLPLTNIRGGGSRPCSSYLCLRGKLVLNSMGTKYVEECCKGQTTVKPFQQLWSNLVYSLKIIVFTYSL